MQINCILTTVLLNVEVFVSQLVLVRSRTDKAQGAVALFFDGRDSWDNGVSVFEAYQI